MTATASLADRSAEFQQRYPKREVVLDGSTWRYWAAGEGDRALVILPGGLRLGDAAFQIVTALASQRRVLTVDYPPVPTIAGLSDGLARLLDHEGLQRADVLGSSLGGMLAQFFVRRHSNRVDRLMLCSTRAPTPALVPRMRLVRTGLRAVPTPLLKHFMQRTFRKLTSLPAEDRAFWARYLQDAVASRLARADLDATYHNLIDYHATCRFTANELHNRGKRVLLLDAADDQVVNEPARQALRALYPHARHEQLPTGGHTLFIARFEQAMAILTDFLATD